MPSDNLFWYAELRKNENCLRLPEQFLLFFLSFVAYGKFLPPPLLFSEQEYVNRETPLIYYLYYLFNKSFIN